MNKSTIDNKECAQEMLNNMKEIDFPHVRNAVYRNEWISVKDCLPEHNQFVLVIIPCEIMAVARCDISLGNYVFMSLDLRHQIPKVTHWMTLPEPPKETINE